MVFFFNADTDSEGKMYESLFPADDIWEKFDIPPADYDYSDVLLDNDPDPVMNELPPFVPTSYVMGRHDCMWAGMCGNGYHVNHDITKPKSAPVVAVTVTVKSSRSVLRTNRQTKICSPRPDTPSESEEDESPLYKSVCENEDFSLMVSVSEVTGQISRTSAEYKSISSPTSPDPSQTVFHTDHSYHLSKTAVALDNLGVQTPSDSEEEIDVVSVVDREKLTTLPTNPSAEDKQELQQTVATAIEHREARRKKRQSDEEDNERPMKRRRGRPTEYDSEDTSDKRNQHNNMERLRRIDLRDSITRLRGMVPSVSKNERAPKVQILKEAAIYCHKLTAKQENLLLQKEKLVAMQRALTAQVRQLRLKNAKERGFEKQELQWIQHNEQESSSRGDKHKRQHKERKRKKVLKLVKIAGEQ